VRQPTTASSLAGATRVRTIVLAILALAAGILMAGQARPAHADHGRTFGFLTHQATVDEGEALVLDVIVGGNSSSPAVIVGFNIDLATAEAGDVQGDFCLNVPSGAVSLIQQVSISTFADTDTADETFTVAITFDDEAINGCTPNAGPVGHQAQPAADDR
jgi:ABC-type amino acid transport substrate-binding protein